MCMTSHNIPGNFWYFETEFYMNTLYLCKPMQISRVLET